ncbi:acetyl-CoA hydrolase/transferase family protein [Martelella mediterranea]|uniref:Succinyl-CoA:acetate CoA-transferase n=1 Tax=Martelella mediterranea TaxID=293089 RepID=A0A4R3P2Z0_9HYPH|nr:acetyl-CoA hydrolase/transferase family protein [Martelella mediterranea]TCT45088.1 succinyl-CoA:acetate CoA-transferase [Martelella mediterranea]
MDNRVRDRKLRDKIVSAEEAANLIHDGMVVGMSGFTRAGEAMAVPLALAERAKKEPFRITLMTGASLGNDLDKTLAEAHVLSRRMPFQVDPVLRSEINAGEVMFTDQHLSQTVELLRTRQIPPVQVAVIEAVAVLEHGGIVPTTSVGNSASFAILADKVIVEVNLHHPETLIGLHDVFIPAQRPSRTPIPVVAPESRVGLPYIPIPPEKIAAIVITDKQDSEAKVQPPDAETRAIAGHLMEFLKHEVKQGRLTNSLLPLQAGIGAIANAVMNGFLDSPFENLKMYSEVLQDSTFELFDAGKLAFASGSSITLSNAMYKKVFADLDRYKSRLILRPQEVSNHPEVVRRLGTIGINTALEFDIYGNINSTHVGGTHMMNGIGGSGDFARNGFLSVFVTKSLAKGGAISSVVPMVSHVDHTEHDVSVVVTDVGLADLRGLAPRERARQIIDHCVHPIYREKLNDYFERACHRGGHTPHVMEEAFSWHTNLKQYGSMMPEARAAAE